jgi:hypothetical protein
MVGADNLHVPAGSREGHVIDFGAKFNVTAEEVSEFGELSIAAMCESNAPWAQTTSRQLSAQPDQTGYEKFHLVTIEMAADPDVVESYDDISVIRISRRYAFIGN